MINTGDPRLVWVGRDLKAHLNPPLPWTGPLPLSQFALGQLCLEHFFIRTSINSITSFSRGGMLPPPCNLIFWLTPFPPWGRDLQLLSASPRLEKAISAPQWTAVDSQICVLQFCVWTWAIKIIIHPPLFFPVHSEGTLLLIPAFSSTPKTKYWNTSWQWSYGRQTQEVLNRQLSNRSEEN